MANSPSNSLSEPAIIEQVITEFFAKSLHIILESRSPFVSSRNYSGDPFASSPSSSSSSSSGRPRDRWFNLALRDCPAALENFDLWRQSNLEPLVIDVVLVCRPSGQDALPAYPYPPAGCLVRTLSAKDPLWPPQQDDFVSDSKSKKIVERWIVQYEARKSPNIAIESHSGSKKSRGGSSHSSEIPSLYKKTYKRSIVLLRSLYLTVRLLPAYKVFRDLNSSSQIRSFSLSHRISSFVEPFTRAEDAEMSQFSFPSVDTPCGRLSLSVSYLPTLDDMCSEPSTPLSTQIIADYVGSPTTDRLKRFSSLPSSGQLPTFPLFTRCHSWSNDHRGVPSLSPSPSPTHSNSRALRCTPDHTREQSPFSPSSSSPSTPGDFCSGHLPNALLRTESAPVSIPLPRIGKSSGLVNHGLPPSPYPRVTKPGSSSSHTDVLGTQISTSSASQTSSPESKIRIKKEPPRFIEFQTDSHLQKVLSFRRDDAENLSGLCTSPQIPISRRPSRLTFLEEPDDSDFVCPFALDDEELSDSYNRVEPSDVKGHESGISECRGLPVAKMSQDAAIGALVKMFKAAPSLQRDLSNSVKTKQFQKDREVRVQRLDNAASSSKVESSGLFKSKTAADAFTELRQYKEMKELLLGQGEFQSSDNNCTAESAPGVP